MPTTYGVPERRDRLVEDRPPSALPRSSGIDPVKGPLDTQRPLEVNDLGPLAQLTQGEVKVG
jgi:hypothetical protein